MVLSATGIKRLTIVLWLFIRKMAAYPMPEMRQFRWPRVSTLALLIAMIGFRPIMWSIYTRQLPNVMRILG